MTIRQHDKRSVDGERKGQKHKKTAYNRSHTTAFFHRLQKKATNKHVSLVNRSIVIIVATRIDSFEAFNGRKILLLRVIIQLAKARRFCSQMTLFFRCGANCDSLQKNLSNIIAMIVTGKRDFLTITTASHGKSQQQQQQLC